MALRRESIAVNPDWNPWAPLDVDAPLNLLTRFKLSRLSGDAAACNIVLRQSGIEFEPLKDRQTGPACGFENAVQIRRTSGEVGQPFALSCRTAISLALWERHVLQPAARSQFGHPVVRIEHFGSYSCRNVYGRPQSTRSRHATAEAWDIAGFVLADGQRIRLARDWNGDAGKAAFLRNIRNGACQVFDGVLSPDYNAAHHDHFHLDRGPARVCR